MYDIYRVFGAITRYMNFTLTVIFKKINLLY